MNMLSLLILLLTITSGCTGCHTNDDAQTEKKISYKLYKKTGVQDTDTLWVSQNDTAVFRAEEYVQRRPCSKAQLAMRYELRNPKDGAYYFIYNDKQQLIQEGKYTASYVYEGKTIEQGNFYNSKMYFYKKNGNLNSIHYQEDGRNLKTELFNRKRMVTEIIYFNKKSGDKEKVEIYKNGKRKETRIYTAFNVYHILKAKE